MEHFFLFRIGRIPVDSGKTIRGYNGSAKKADQKKTNNKF
ncbi:hypothetical protein LEP1GSC116_1530 [Leptospira interrogans serovar Icterohaemorrhagiae str. Verdun HP]|uniref:Uncharacterized protein n=1 Tax=Leptospira interrogans serovar Icterohaemorrhagiae str. Verdun HP TaxID=1049910 RepID=M6R386_LEPIR|nr:hypothetical protein LEP1GSC116_1530 [Leptospira interrogans serovar Icterohaemorrhagiae str. Verdun HP]